MKNVSIVKVLIIVLAIAALAGGTVSKAQGRGNQETGAAGGQHPRKGSPKDPFVLSTPSARPQVIRVPVFLDEPPATFISSPEPPGLGTIQALEVPTIARAAPRGRVFALDEQASIITQQGEMPLLAATPPFSVSFDSTDFDDNGRLTDFVFIPPDPIAAAGPNHVVNVVNVMVRFHPKNNTVDFEASLRDFFADPLGGSGCAMNPSTFPFDPKVIYDQYEDRFLIVVLEQTTGPNTSRIFLAVSTTSDPNDSWTCIVINSNIAMPQSHWADYPGFAVDDQAVYITANMFRFSGPQAFGGVHLWIIDKEEGTGGFYDGGAASVTHFDPYAGAGIEVTTQPAHMFGTAPANVGTFLVSYSGLTQTSSGLEAVQVVRIDDPLGTPTFTQEFVFVTDIEDFAASFPLAPQIDSASLIETNDRRALHAVWRNDSLWFTTTIAPNAGPDAGEATAHWFELDTSALGCEIPPCLLTLADQGNIGGEDILDQGNLATQSNHTFFPAIAVNLFNDVAIGFSASGPDIHPGSYYTIRQLGDGPGITNGSEVLRKGSDVYVRTFGGTRNRWGDYSGMAVDPENQCFWVYNEHAIAHNSSAPPNNDGRWGTAYGFFCPPCSETFALTAGQWKQISLSCDVGASNTVEAVIGDDLTGDRGANWEIVKWDPNVQLYTLPDQLNEGEGYWVKTLDPNQSVTIEGVLNQVIEFPLTSDATNGRFNMVGTPFKASVCWADVRVNDNGTLLSLDEADPLVGGTRACDLVSPDTSCRMSRVGHRYNAAGSAYETFDGETMAMEGTLEVGDGLWVKAFKAGISLRIPLEPSPAAGCYTEMMAGPATSGPATGGPASGGFANGGPPATGGPGSGGSGGPNSTAPEGWFVRLIAEAGNLRDAGNVLGQLPDSMDGYDRHDLKELAPFDSPYLTIVFPHPDWGDQAGDYTSDFHALQERLDDQWSFEVRTSESGQLVTIRWEGEASLLQEMVLRDQETGRNMPIRPDGRFTFRINGTRRAFLWLAGGSRAVGRP